MVKIKSIILMVSFLLVSGCSVSPPEPPKAKGEWVELNTKVSDIVRG